jgi:magnesium-transporting ATPase (P-type)
MVTGDNIDTAKAIALEAGILGLEQVGRKYAVMEGK